MLLGKDQKGAAGIEGEESRSQVRMQFQGKFLPQPDPQECRELNLLWEFSWRQSPFILYPYTRQFFTVLGWGRGWVVQNEESISSDPQ